MHACVLYICFKCWLQSTRICKALNFSSEFFLPGCKESAFLYAITSAGVAHSVTKACSSGMYSSCGCDRSLTGRPSGDWEWRGCHSNVKFAGGLTKEFSSARVSKTGHVERKKMNRHNIRAGIKVGASSPTRVEISHLVASLPTNRQQVVFALLVPSLEQAVYNL